MKNVPSDSIMSEIENGYRKVALTHEGPWLYNSPHQKFKDNFVSFYQSQKDVRHVGLEPFHKPVGPVTTKGNRTEISLGPSRRTRSPYVKVPTARRTEGTSDLDWSDWDGESPIDNSERRLPTNRSTTALRRSKETRTMSQNGTRELPSRISVPDGRTCRVVRDGDHQQNKKKVDEITLD